MLIEQGRNCIWFQTLLVMEFLRQGCIGARQLLQEPGLRRASQRPEDGVGGFSGEERRMERSMDVIRSVPR